MENSSKPVKVPHVRAREQGDDLALFDVTTARYFVLNEMGREIWNFCTGENTIEDIARKIEGKVEDVPSLEEIIEDVKELIEDLNSKNLIKLEENK